MIEPPATEGPKDVPSAEDYSAALMEALGVIERMTAELVQTRNEAERYRLSMEELANNFGLAVLVLWHLAKKEKLNTLSVPINTESRQPVLIDFNEVTKVYTITALTSEDVDTRKKKLN